MHGSSPARRHLAHAHALRPGDVLGFSACSLSGAVINLTTKGIPCWGLSHVAIVCEAPTESDRPGLVLCESTTLHRSPCVVTRRVVSGVQFQGIDQRVRTYRGKVWHYPLAEPLNLLETLLLTKYCQQQAGKSYDWRGAVGARDLFWGRVRRIICASLGRCGREQAMHYLFCSELVAGALNDLGRFRTLHADHWSPNRLARAGLDRGTFAKPVRIK